METAIKNKVLKEDLIRKSLEIFSSNMTDEERKQFLTLDIKTREKILYKKMGQGIIRNK